MFIYKITNLINGKIYIGQTIRNLEIRWKQHCKSNTGCSAIKNAIIKYGKQNFTIELIQKCKNQKTLDKKEKYWIKKLNSLSPLGYNLTSGGEHGTYSCESKLKMSKARKGKFTGKDHPFSKTIKCLQNNKTYYSIHEASKKLNIAKSDICSVLKGRRKHAKNHNFIYVNEDKNG